MNLQNKTAIITGASRGIGKAIAENLALAGATVLLVARNSDELNKVVKRILEKGGKAYGFAFNVSDEQAVAQFIAEAEKTYTHIDVLVNNAGIGQFDPVTETDGAFWDEVMEVNVKGTFLFCKYVIRIMQQQGGGHIVNIASDVAKRTFENGAMYCASKYAQDAFSSALRKEVRKDHIKVSVIYPGLVNTYFNGGSPGEAQNATHLHPEDIANTVNYVVSAPRNVVIDELMIHPLSQEY